MDEKSFEGMRNLQFLIVRDYVGYWVPQGRLLLPQGLFYIPRKLRLLRWDAYPSKCLPSNFKAEYLVELRMKNSSLEKLWEGTLVLLFFFLNTNLLSFIIKLFHYNNKRGLYILFGHKHNIQHINSLRKISLQPKMTANSRRSLNASSEPSRQSRTAGE